MANADAAAKPDGALFDQKFMLRVLAAFTALALLSLGISVGGKWLGRTMSLAGHTDSARLHEIVIGNDVLVAPANAIRFERERRDGVAATLHLYLRWPDLTGYSAEARDEFNHVGGSRTIVFLSFEPRMMSRDMSGRLEPIYRSLIEQAGEAGPSGLTRYRFTEKSGYMNEVLVVSPHEGAGRFVARCLTGPTAAESLASCERDVHVGKDLTLSYRFPEHLLEEWRLLDAKIMALVGRMIRTGA